MKQYLMSVIHDWKQEVPPEVMEQVYADVDALNHELEDAGAWVFGGGLQEPGTAKVVHDSDGEVATTDGPYLETKEHLGGFWVITADDLDAALEWGRKASRACQQAIEVRPFQEEPEE